MFAPLLRDAADATVIPAPTRISASATIKVAARIHRSENVASALTIRTPSYAMRRAEGPSQRPRSRVNQRRRKRFRQTNSGRPPGRVGRCSSVETTWSGSAGHGRPLLVPDVERDGQEQDDALDHLLRRLVDTHELHA